MLTKEQMKRNKRMKKDINNFKNIHQHFLHKKMKKTMQISSRKTAIKNSLPTEKSIV